MTTQDQLDKRRRRKSLKVTVDALKAALDNSDGFKRLTGLTDEEWDKAQGEDDQKVTEGEK